ncbi:MAG: helix-turn-helix domain-containing protein [Ruminiclostridium sp.]
MELCIENPIKNIKLPIYLDENAINSYDRAMFKIILIEAGKTIIFIDEKPMVLSAPALLCLNEKENFRVQKETDLLIRVIYFNPSIVNSYFNIENVYYNIDSYAETAKLDHFYFTPFINRSSIAAMQIEIGLLTAKKISSVFDTLRAQISSYNDNFWPCRIRSYLIELLFITQHCYSNRDILTIDIPETDSCINDILLYLHLNYSRKITIDELTKEFHTNRNTLSKNFKIETGLSIIAYTHKLRIKAACMLLRDTSLPVSEIMQRVGFNDVSYWGRAFKSVSGLSPSDYRKFYNYTIVNKY